jgi:hypothetical protein
MGSNGGQMMQWSILIFIAALWLISPIILLIALIVSRRQLGKPAGCWQWRRRLSDRGQPRIRRSGNPLPRRLLSCPSPT